MYIFGKIIFRRHNRVGVEINDGRIYHVIDMDVDHCSFESGEIVKAKVINEQLSEVQIIGTMDDGKKLF